MNPQSTCHGPRPGPTLAPWCSVGLPAFPGAESARKDPRPEEKKMPMCNKKHIYTKIRSNIEYVLSFLWCTGFNIPSARRLQASNSASPPRIAVPATEIFFLLSTPLSLRFLPCPLRAARAWQKPPLPRRLSPSMLLPSRALHREPTPPQPLIRPRPSLRRLRAAPPLGRADEHPLALALSRLLSIMASGPTGPLVHPRGVLTPRRESHDRNRLWPSLRPLLLPQL